MEKKYDSISLNSKIVNYLVKFFSNKKVYSNKQLTQEFINKNNTKENTLPQKFKLNKEEVFSIPVYTFNGTLKESKEKILVYLHGGSFIEEAVSFQYKFVMKLAMETNSTLIIPSYDLAPKGNCQKAIEDLTQIWEYLSKNEKEINLIGDSAGGGLAVSLSMYLKENNIKTAKNILLISPWFDIKLDNPEIKNIEPKDTMSGVEGNQYAGELWSKGYDLNNYLVSPLYGDCKDLGLITIVTGEYDILKPDCILFKEKLKEANQDYNYYEYKQQIHDFAMLPTKEGREVLKDFSNIINKDK